MTIVLADVNERGLEHSLERIGEEITLTSLEGVRYVFKGQIVRVYDTAGEDSRGIAQGSRQLNKVVRASVTLRNYTVREAGIESMEGFACTIPIEPRRPETQVMFVEAAPAGDISLGIRVLELVRVRKLRA